MTGFAGEDEFERGTRARISAVGGVVYEIRGDDHDVPSQRLYWLVPQGTPAVRENADGGLWVKRDEFQLIYDVPDLSDQEQVEAWLG